MKPIRIFRHDEPVDAGYFTDFLIQNEFEFELITIDQGDAVTFDLENVSGLVFLGGDSCVHDGHPWIDDELKLIHKAYNQKFPIFGHCFGAQLITKALGYGIAALPTKEIGWYALNWVQNSITEEWFECLPENIHALHWHEYALEVPRQAIPLFGTQYCPNQAFVLDNIVATTAHVEVTSEMLKQWTVEYADQIKLHSKTIQSQQEMLRNVDKRVKQMQSLTNILYTRWINMVKIFHT